jgi:hypothetical protein
LRIVRLVRVFRIFKLSRHFKVSKKTTTTNHSIFFPRYS